VKERPGRDTFPYIAPRPGNSRLPRVPHFVSIRAFRGSILSIPSVPPWFTPSVTHASQLADLTQIDNYVAKNRVSRHKSPERKTTKTQRHQGGRGDFIFQTLNIRLSQFPLGVTSSWKRVPWWLIPPLRPYPPHNPSPIAHKLPKLRSNPRAFPRRSRQITYAFSMRGRCAGPPFS
jgi:hypothetical protein